MKHKQKSTRGKENLIMTPMPPSPLHPPGLATFVPSAALALLPFDAALFVVSNYLAEARIASDAPDALRARTLYDAAEACALQTGYVELMQLVWNDAQNAHPPPSRSRPPRSATLSQL